MSDDGRICIPGPQTGPSVPETPISLRAFDVLRYFPQTIMLRLFEILRPMHVLLLSRRSAGPSLIEIPAHLVHALTGVPVEEGLAAEHAGELLGDALHDLLHAGRVAAEADRHLEALGRDVADRALEVVRDPLDEVRRVLVLDAVGVKGGGRGDVSE